MNICGIQKYVASEFIPTKVMREVAVEVHAYECLIRIHRIT